MGDAELPTDLSGREGQASRTGKPHANFEIDFRSSSVSLEALNFPATAPASTAEMHYALEAVAGAGREVRPHRIPGHDRYGGEGSVQSSVAGAQLLRGCRRRRFAAQGTSLGEET